MVIEAHKGLVCQEAENIRLKNVTLLTTDTKPVLEVQNSKNSSLNGIRYASGADVLLRVSGDRSQDIHVTNTKRINPRNTSSITLLPARRCCCRAWYRCRAMARKNTAWLRQQLTAQPRTKEGGFWHKKTYPNQMWLGGLYMAEPFYAQYSVLTGDAAGLDDVARQFALIEKHLADPKTGLLHHGYDESREQKWASKATGQSPNAWDRAIGWYAMALVDVLDYVPAGTWSLVMGHETEKGNYAEASGSSRCVYALALNGTVSVGGLGGNPYRDGSYAYYLSEPLRKNDLKGVGPFILASTEREIAQEDAVGQGKTVGLDYYSNHEMRKNTFTGQPEQWHYTWQERTHGGFWLWGNQLGARTVPVPTPPTAASLKGLNVYVIMDPDAKKELPVPNYLSAADGKAVTDWVRAARWCCWPTTRPTAKSATSARWPGTSACSSPTRA